MEAWDVQVLDEANRPVSGVRVSQSCGDDVVSWRNDENRYTDTQGRMSSTQDRRHSSPSA